MLQWLDLARAHAPLLITIAPLFGAAIAVLCPGPRLAWVAVLLATMASAAIALDMGGRWLLTAAPRYVAADGVALEVDGVNVFAAPVVALVGALTALGSGPFLVRDYHPRAAPFAAALIACMSAGWLGALFARDGAALFAAVEIGWFAAIGVVALAAEHDRAALGGALRMLIAGAGAAALLLLGVGFVGRGAESAALDALDVDRLPGPRAAAIGAGLMLAGLALKAGVAPLQLWLGGAVSRAGMAAALALGALGLVGALAVLMRFGAIAVAAPGLGDGAAVILAVFGALSVVVGSLQAIGARNLRRMAAYAMTAQAGCALMGLALGSPAALAAALVQLLAQAAAALALFGGAAALGAPALAALDGASRRAPIASAAASLGALSLMGAPLSLGFLGRWRLIEAGVGGGWWWTAAAMIGASLAAVIYGGRLVERLYFRHATHAVERRADLAAWALAPALIAALLAILWGAAPGVLLHAADVAARLQLGEGP